MKKIAFALTAFLFVFTACQKEPDFIDTGNSSGNGDGTINSGLLVRSVEVNGADSTAIAYAYNTAGRLTQLDVSSTAASPFTYKLLRNTNGIITQTVAISPDLAAIGIDSLVTNVFYNASAARYTYTRYDLNVGGVAYSDSTAFAYDASGNLTSAISYQKVMLLPYAPSSRTDYSYSNGNVATEKAFDYDVTTSAWSLLATSAYTYDAKTNPLKLGAEAMIIGLTTFFGPNNTMGLTYTDATDPTNNYTQASTYTYNSASKPSSGTIVENPGAVNYSLRYYYN